MALLSIMLVCFLLKQAQAQLFSFHLRNVGLSKLIEMRFDYDAVFGGVNCGFVGDVWGLELDWVKKLTAIDDWLVLFEIWRRIVSDNNLRHSPVYNKIKIPFYKSTSCKHIKFIQIPIPSNKGKLIAFWILTRFILVSTLIY